MTESINYLSGWWRWWSNPLINIHSTQRDMMPYAKAQLEDLDFLQFLELRSILSVADKPDRALDEQIEIRSMALATPEEVSALNMKAAVLSLDSAILQTNAHTWERIYGVKSADEARSIIQLWNQIPYTLKSWQESLIINLNASKQETYDLQERATLVLGAYLTSYYPDFFKRWSLTAPYRITLLLKSIDLFPDDCKPAIDNWLIPLITELHKTVLLRFPENTPELPEYEEDLQEQEALAQLASLEDFDNA